MLSARVLMIHMMKEVKDTKVEDDSFYLLTLATVAKELKRRGLEEAKVFLAVGLPLTRFGAEKNDFIKYLTKNKRVKEVLSRVQKVKAESLDDAINKAMDMYYAEQIVLGAEDMKGVDFAPISEGQLPSSLKENGGKAR